MNETFVAGRFYESLSKDIDFYSETFELDGENKFQAEATIPIFELNAREIVNLLISNLTNIYPEVYDWRYIVRGKDNDSKILTIVIYFKVEA